MIFFKREQNNTIIPAIILSVLLVGCSASVSDSDDPNQGSGKSNFVVSNISMTSTPQEVFEDTYAVSRPSHRTYTIKACFKDAIFLEPLRFSDFKISGKKKTFTSDSEGCVRWSEKLRYTTKVGERNQRIKRTIESLSKYKGKKTIPFAINVINNRFVDLRHEDIPDENTGILTKDDQNIEFSVTSMRLRFGAYSMEHDDSRALKEVQSKGTACFAYKVDGDGLSRKDLKVRILNKQGEVVQRKGIQTTNLNGCLVPFTVTTEYDQFTEMKWVRRTMVVEPQDGALKGQVLRHDFCINPWMTSFNHFWECGVEPAPDNPTEETAKLFFDQVTLSYKGNQNDGYKVNRYLDMQLTKKYKIQFDPKINRGHNFSTNQIVDPIFTGQFLLRAAILSPKNGETELTQSNLEDFKFISGTKEKVDVIDGKINDTISLPFKFTEMPRAARRTIIVIELSSLDPNAESLKPIIASGQFIPSKPVNSWILRPHTRQDFPNSKRMNIQKSALMAKLEKIDRAQSQKGDLKSDWRGTPQDILQALLGKNNEYQNYTLDEAKKSVSSKLEEDDLSILMNNPQEENVLKKFCSFYFGEDKDKNRFYASGTKRSHFIHKCRKNPGKYIKVDPMQHVHEITSRPQKLFANNNDRIDVGTGFVTSDSVSDRDSRATRQSVSSGLDIKIPFLSIFSLGGGYKTELSHMTSHDEAQGTTGQTRISRSRTLMTDQFKLGFDAKVKNCVLIKGTSFKKKVQVPQPIIVRYKEKEVELKKKAQICEDGIHEQWIEEDWYYINEPLPFESAMTDRWNPAENYFAKLIRGQKNYEKFYQLMTDKTKTIHLRKIGELKNNNHLLNKVYKAQDKRPMLEDGGIPGIIQPGAR